MTDLSFLIFLTAFFSLISFVFAFFQLRVKCMKETIGGLFMTSVFIWNLGYALELMSIDMDAMIFWRKFQMIGVVFVPLFFSLYILKISNLEKYLRKSIVLLLAIFPLLTLALSFTNGLHYLIWDGFTVLKFENINYLSQYPGPGILTFYGYSGVVSIVSALILVLTARRSAGFYLGKTLSLISSVSVPVLIGGAHLFKLNAIPFFYFDSIVIAISGMIMILSDSLLKPIDLLIVSSDIVFNDITTGILVLDKSEKIVKVSKGFLEMFGVGEVKLHKQPLDSIAKVEPALFELIKNGLDEMNQFEFEYAGCFFSMDSQIICDWGGNNNGIICSFQDISQIKKQSQTYLELLDASEAIAAESNPEKVLLSLAKQLVEISGFNLCYISEWDVENNALVAMAEYSIAIWSVGPDQYEIDSYPSTKKVIDSRQAVVINDVEDEAEQKMMEEMGWGKMVMFPLIAGEVVIGLVEIAKGRNFASFEAEEIEKYQHILDTAASELTAPYSSNPYEVMMTLLKALKEIDTMGAIALSEWDPERKLLITRGEMAEIFWLPKEGPTLRIEHDSSAQKALFSGYASVVYRSDAAVPPADQLDMGKWNAQTLVSFPLSIQGEAIGLIELYHTGEKVNVSTAELSMWRTLADKVGFTIQNNRLLALANKKLDEQTTLLNVANTTSSSLDVTKILTELAKQVALAMGGTSAYFITHDIPNRTSTVVAEYYCTDASAKEMISDLGEPYEEEEWLRMKVEHSHFEVVHYDDEKMPESERIQFVDYEAKTILYLPLFVQDRMLGHTEIWDSQRKREYSSDQIRFCRAIANQAALALENAVLMENMQEEVAQRKKSQVLQQTSEKYYRGLFENAHDAILLFSPDDETVLDVNQRACDLYGFSREEFLALKLIEISEDVPEGQAKITEILSRQSYHNFETIQRKKNGQRMHLEVNASLVEYEGKTSILSINRDITSRKRLEEKLKFDALHDPLTKLSNRALFMDRLDQVLGRQKRESDFGFAVLFFDIDNFKDINDTMGHTVGDKYLIEVAESLRKITRETDTVSRFGGDEFAILVNSVNGTRDIELICQKVFDAVNREVVVENNSIKSTLSIGVLIQEAGEADADSIIRDADTAMYRAKETPGNRFEIFDDSMRKDLLEHMAVKEDLAKALENGQLSLHYQPIISMSDGTIFCLEALIRWEKTKGQLIYPSAFIHHAETGGLINQISEWVVGEALAQISEWQTQMPNGNAVRVSVNISGMQLDDVRFFNKLIESIQSSGVDRNSLCLEITESSFISKIEQATETLKMLNEEGIQFFLDDFGTGQSSLFYLSQLPANVLKIDKYFIGEIGKATNLNLLQSMISLGHDMGMKVVAEGIETEKQFELLKDMGCDFGQGFFIKEGVDKKEILSIIQAGKIAG